MYVKQFERIFVEKPVDVGISLLLSHTFWRLFHLFCCFLHRLSFFLSFFITSREKSSYLQIYKHIWPIHVTKVTMYLPIKWAEYQYTHEQSTSMCLVKLCVCICTNIQIFGKLLVCCRNLIVQLYNFAIPFTIWHECECIAFDELPKYIYIYTNRSIMRKRGNDEK